ncbi:MAG: ADOP family duplicated permease [Acidobacteriota bacterium]
MSVFADIKYSLRTLAAAKGFTITAVLILAVGLGVNSATFAILNRVLWTSPKHVPDPDQLFWIELKYMAVTGQSGYSPNVSYPLYEHLKGTLATASGLAAEAQYEIGFGQGAVSEEIRALLVSTNYFSVVGVSVLFGRSFTTDDSWSQVAVLSYKFWKRKFGGDVSVVGADCWLANRSYTIIGVLPEGFAGTELRSIDVWLPVEAAADDAYPLPVAQIIFNPSANWIRLLVRLTPELSPEALATFLSNRLSSTDVSPFSTQPILDVRVRPIQPIRYDSASSVSLAGWGTAVSFLALLVACGNVTNLLLLRNIYRSHEIAIRSQLGATPWRLARQLLIECFLLSGLAAALALCLVWFTSSLITGILIGESLVFTELFSGRIAIVLIATGVVTTLLTGMLPALRATQVDLIEALRDRISEPAFATSKLRAALVVGQLALGCILLTGATLFWRSFHNAAEVDLGFDATRSVIVELPGLEKLGYTAYQIRELYNQLAGRATQIPGVEAVSQTSSLPFRLNMVVGCKTLDREVPARGETYLYAVTHEYFATMGMKMLDGRSFDWADSESSKPVVIVNQKMASLFWPGQKPIGGCLYIARSMICTEVIGVVADSVVSGFKEESKMQYFIPLGQSSRYQFPIQVRALVIRAPSDPTVRQNLTEALSNLPNVPYIRTRSLDSELEPQLRIWKRGSILFGVLSVIAFTIAIVGYYGQLAYWLTNRRHEIGIRVALGASPARLVRFMLRQALVLSAIGLSLGILASAILTRFMESLFYGITANDPVTLGAVGVVFLSVTLITSLVPCYRAITISPADSLRSDGTGSKF